MSTTLESTNGLRGRTLGVLIVLCGAIFIEGTDVSMMGVALPSIRAELGLATTELQWVVSAYVLGFGGFVLLGGRASDLLGRRRMFLIWLAVFIAFSGLGGFATEGWILMLSRFATGVAAGFLSPAGLSIITTSFPEGRVRNRAVLFYAGMGAGGFTVGLVVGGLLTELGWRWVFFAPVLIALALMALAVPLIPRDEPTVRTRGGFDLLGAAVLTGAMLALVAGIVRAHEVDVLTTAATLLAGVVLLGVFVVVERRAAAPLVRLGILRSAPRLRANAGAMLLIAGFMGFQFVVVLYLRELRGWSAIETGLAMLLAGLDMLAAPTLTPLLVNRFGNRRVAFSGLVLAAVAYALVLPLGPDWGFWSFLPTMVLIGLAFALAYGPLTIESTDGVAEAEQGLASGLLTTAFQFGAALGLAVTTIVVVSTTGTDPTPATQLAGYRAGFVVPLVAAALGALVIATGLRRRVPAPA